MKQGLEYLLLSFSNKFSENENIFGRHIWPNTHTYSLNTCILIWPSFLTDDGKLVVLLISFLFIWLMPQKQHFSYWLEKDEACTFRYRCRAKILLNVANYNLSFSSKPDSLVSKIFNNWCVLSERCIFDVWPCNKKIPVEFTPVHCWNRA